MDPQTGDFQYDFGILQNVYETLIWYNGTSSSQTIPWLAQSYNVSSDGTTVDFVLRQGIKFADGEQLNSSAVYFSLNRLLLMDGSTPTSHGSQVSWYVQQLLNTSLSTTLSGPQPYSARWVNEVLAQNFIQITGQYTFTVHLLHPDASFPYLMSGEWADIMAPSFVISHDLSLWSQQSQNYSLPYPSPSGNATTAINQYFYDLVATCNSGATPKGCGTTYLQTSFGGSQAGTGPYTIASSTSSGDFVLKSNPGYWGGPYQFSSGGQKITPRIQTINIKYVPQYSTRLIDLKSAGKSGQALIADVTAENLYDVADKNSWLQGGTLQSSISGVSIYGPYPEFNTYFVMFGMNVTNPFTGQRYTFQPFADLRFRLAFADSVNMTEINQDINNNIGVVANSIIPPGFAPVGVYNASLHTRYSYNLTAVQDLLLDAMQHPLTQFTFVNGSAAPPGTFNNSFGCTTLNSNGQCSNPVPQTITLAYATGDTEHEAVFTQMASVVNNISTTYNMGLTVQVEPIPEGQLLSSGISNQLYAWTFNWRADYPWVTSLLGPLYAPGNAAPSANSWNYTQLGVLFSQAVAASATGNITGLVNVSYQMNSLANQLALYLWTTYPEVFAVMTSNLHGFYYNLALDMQPGYYFAAMY